VAFWLGGQFLLLNVRNIGNFFYVKEFLSGWDAVGLSGLPLLLSLTGLRNVAAWLWGFWPWALLLEELSFR
jgi:hypothetical protein